MTNQLLPTEPLRAEHSELRPHLDAIDAAADGAHRWDADEARQVLSGIVEFLHGHLLPHAHAEEEVLYPAVEDAMGAPGATATMRADHAELIARIEHLAATVDAVGPGWADDPERARDAAHQLVGLSAILRLHFAKEEDVLLPVLDRSLDTDQAAELFARMGEVAHS
jgi:hemerythrin-like domain-containing protein